MAITPRAQRFRADQPIVDKEGRPSIAFLRDLNGAIEIVNAIAEAQAAAAAANAAAATAQSAAETAQTAAEGAQAAADGAAGVGGAAAQEQSIQGSYPANFTGSLISADETGVVTIADHDRVYGNSTLNPTVAVTGDVLAIGALPGDIVRVYYDDPARSGGAVTYQTTADPSVAVQTGARHSVGAVRIPLTGTDDGQFLKPPGYVEI